MNLEQELEERNRQLQAIFRITSALYAKQDLDGMLQETLKVALEVVNADAGTLYLYNPECNTLVFRYVIGEKADELTGRDIPADEGVAGEVFQIGQPKISEDVTREPRHLQGVGQRIGYRTRNMVTVPLKDIDGKPIGVLQALNKREGDFDEHDMETLSILATLAATAIETVRIHEERKLAIIARLLGDISHDIKNMLTPIITTAQTLELLYRPVQEGLKQLEKLKTGNGVWDRVAETLKETLKPFDSFFQEAVIMIEKGSGQIQERVREISDAIKGVISEPQFELIDVNEVIERVLQALKPVAQRQGVELRLEQVTTIPKVLLDPKRLYNAFYNLVNNAIPETPSGGWVAVRTYVRYDGEFPEGNYLGIEVADTGRGIPPEVKESLFTDKAVSTKAGGTGLGTRIVKNVVDAHGGVIWVESELGKGSTFFIRLPLRLPQNPP